MKVEQILQLIEAVSHSELAEFKYEEDGIKLNLKKAGAAQAAKDERIVFSGPVFSQPVSAESPAPAAPSAQTEAAAAVPGNVPAQPEAEIPSGKIVKSPLVGTFYAAPSEDAEPFVKVGDSVKEGQVLAIVEAMKLMNEIESDYAGTIAEILVENGQAVEYGQPLFVIS